MTPEERRELRERVAAYRLRIGHQSWRDYYRRVRASGVAGPLLAGVMATYAYIVQTIRLQ